MRGRPPSFASCFLLLILMDVMPRVIGLRRTFKVARRLGDTHTPTPKSAALGETTRRLLLAAAYYPRRALCLEQSLALYVLLRRQGIPAELRLGAQPLPFYAHAWVEVEGEPVSEANGLPRQVATFNALVP